MIEPVYYARRVSRRDPILPLLITSLPSAQTTMLIAPQFLAKQHDSFIDAVYKNLRTRSHVERTFQRRRYRGLAITLITFHTSASDGSRTGLLLSVGVVTTQSFARQHPHALVKYMETFFHALNSMFSVVLPHSGSQRLVEILRTADGDTAVLQHLTNVMLIGSTVVAETWLPRFGSYIARLWKKQAPFAIMYSDDPNSSGTIEAFVLECARQNSDRFAIDGIGASAWAIPAEVLRQATGAKLVRRGQTRYLVLTRNRRPSA